MGSTAPGRDAGADGRAGADARGGSTGSSLGAGWGEERFAGGEAAGSWSGAGAVVAPPPPLDNRRRLRGVLLNTWTSLATDRSRRRVRRGTRTSSGIGSHSSAFWTIAARRARWRECGPRVIRRTCSCQREYFQPPASVEVIDTSRLIVRRQPRPKRQFAGRRRRSTSHAIARTRTSSCARPPQVVAKSRRARLARAPSPPSTFSDRVLR